MQLTLFYDLLESITNSIRGQNVFVLLYSTVQIAEKGYEMI